MSYDGKVLRRAAAKYDEDKQRREELFRARARECYRKEPRLEEIDRELSHTMAKIIASGFRRGTDPRTAIAALTNPSRPADIRTSAVPIRIMTVRASVMERKRFIILIVLLEKNTMI